MNALELRNVYATIGKFHLQNISLKLEKGTIMGLVGKNGAGKSTLIKTIGNDIIRDSGTILYDGQLYWEHEVEIKKKLGILYDENFINPETNAKKLLQALKLCYSDLREDFFHHYMEYFELPEKETYSKFSTGQKKKFLLILTMSLNPEILILDEPTSGIDPADRDEIITILEDFMADGTHSILFSTHITSDLDRIADSITLIDRGRILISQEKDSLLDSYVCLHALREHIPEEILRHMKGIKESAFGVTGLVKLEKNITKDYLHSIPNIKLTRPTIEELMIHMTMRNAY